MKAKLILLSDCKKRRCLGLKCGRLFDSSHPGNRFCQRCLSKNNAVEIPKVCRLTYEVILGGKGFAE